MLNTQNIQKVLLNEYNPLNNHNIITKIDNFIEKNITKNTFIKFLHFIATSFVLTWIWIFIYMFLIWFNVLLLILATLMLIIWGGITKLMLDILD